MPKKKGSDSSDEDRGNNVPIGYKYEENFPSLPGSEPRNPQNKARGQQSGMSKEIFVANNQHDLRGLQDIKAKFKMIVGSVIQDVYNLM